MKKIALYTVGLCTLVGAAVCGYWVYNQNLINEASLAYSKSYPLNLNTVPNAAGINRLAAQAIISSATVPSKTFNDGRVSTATVTVTTITGLTQAAATDSITFAPTATLLAQSATDQITVISTSSITGARITFTGLGSPNVLTNGVDWNTGATTALTAASIATALSGISGINVSRAGSVVFATATVAGAAGNNFSLQTSTPAAISTGSFHFTGGHDAPLTNAHININGTRIKQGYEWSVQDTSSGTATNIASILSKINGVSASASGSVVTLTATTAGTSGNAFTLFSSSSGYMTVASPTFTGGTDSATVTINGTILKAGVAWSVGASTQATATNIAAAINANSSLNTVIVATASAPGTLRAGVVFSTSTRVGALANYSLSASPSNLITTSGFAGGQDASFTASSPNIFIPAHGFSTALALLYSTGSVAIGGLTNQTTYYTIVVDANDIQLASSSAGAQAGTFITLTSSTTTGPHTYTLAPLNISGTASFKWQGSNDCVNWFDLGVSSVTFASPYTAAAYSWDFGNYNYTCIQANVIAPTAGGLNLNVRVNGK